MTKDTTRLKGTIVNGNIRLATPGPDDGAIEFFSELSDSIRIERVTLYVATQTYCDRKIAPDKWKAEALGALDYILPELDSIDTECTIISYDSTELER